MIITKNLPDLNATTALGRELARLVRKGDVIALHGDLGTGKSTFARGLIQELMGQELDVPSPTFNLVLTYDAPEISIWHYDLYRIEDPEELEELGLEETINGLAIIEWPDRLGQALPQWRLDISLLASENGRIATLTPHGPDWSKRLETVAR